MVCDCASNSLRSPEHHAIWTLAHLHAEQNHRAVTVEDLRRSLPALVVQHVGKHPAWISTKTLTNTQFSLLLALIGDEKTMRGILVNPDCLASRLAWDNPAAGQRAAILSAIAAAAPVEYVEAIAQDRFGTAAWRSSSVSSNEELRQVLMTIQRRLPSSPHSGGDDPF
jgi:hypothetical protein